MGKYFGTDGIRGVAGDYLDTEMAYNVGLGLRKALDSDTVVIGKDTRESGDMLALSVAAGAMRAGMDVLYAGTVPTPVIAHYAKERAMTGIMITASHNPYTDNGIKVIDKGYKMSEESEAIIEAFIDQPEAPKTERFGFFKHAEEIMAVYKNLYAPFKEERMNLNVCFDTANGATYEVAPEILSPLVDGIFQVHGAPDGKNINAQCGSMHIEAIQQAVSENGCDLGFSFDGDGDRVLAVDHKGRLYDGDMLLYVIALKMKKEGTLNKDTVVLTEMSNPGIVKAFKDAGIAVVRTKVGDRNVSLEMQKNDYTLGGENSGHIILKNHLQTGDGILAAVKTMHVIHTERRPIHALCEDVEIFPQITENIRDVDKSVVGKKAVKKAVKDMKKALGKDALVLIRPSGTEPVIRITVSHQDEATVNKAIETLRAIITKEGRDGTDE
ncbi:MAG: phosphoglucosamine mutase [Candidatus Izemoplasmataceae bacterium]